MRAHRGAMITSCRAPPVAYLPPSGCIFARGTRRLPDQAAQNAALQCQCEKCGQYHALSPEKHTHSPARFPPRMSDSPPLPEHAAASALERAVLAAFDAAGPLQAAAAGTFCPRPGQTRLALAVARTLERGGQLVAEAATGVGKTFAYLAPVLLAGERVLISTATKALQEQLFSRDLPALARALAAPVNCRLLKGRGSYLCLYRLELAAHSGDAPAPRRAQLAGVLRWAQRDEDGDIATIPQLDEHSPLTPLITSTRENCLGAECPRHSECFVYRARRRAMDADVLVINHHLFFADLAIRESGMAELLPSVRAVIFDEAHQLNAIGIQFLGQRLSTHQVLDFGRDMLAAGLTLAAGLQPWQELAAAVQRSARALRLAAGRAQQRLPWHASAPDGLDADTWEAALTDVLVQLAAAREARRQGSERAPDVPRLAARAESLGTLAQHFAAAAPLESSLVRWLDVQAHALHLVESPLDIAHAVRSRMLGLADENSAAAGTETATLPPPQPAEDARQRAWVFVSATLGEGDDLQWFTEPCGLTDAPTLRISSPFDYAQQAALYIPASFPDPRSPQHSSGVAQLAAHCAMQLGGRCLVLTTTLRALRTIREQLRAHFAAASVPICVLAQGEAPKSQLMEQFRAAGSDSSGRGGCVLVGSASFWEGVDVPGKALQCLVIDKLPFPPPADPLVAARSRRLQAQARHPFTHYSLPEAAIALKQGAGRLIRSERDRGLLIICDPRLQRMDYGRRLLAALPPMQRLGSEAELQLALSTLAQSNTTNQ